MKHWLAVAGAWLLLAAGTGQPARAQGAVLDQDSRPLAVKRARALLVFQELGGFARPDARAEDNPQELLVEIELSEPAPAGALWLLAAPRGAHGGPAPAAVLDELSAYWRAGAAQAGEAEAWPAPRAVELGPACDLEFLKTLKLKLDEPTWKLLADEAAAGWRFYSAPVPEGARALVARLSFRSACALYPGALGAASVEGARPPLWQLPPLELVILHSHFVNLDDNSAGVGRRVGLERRWQDDELLAAGGHLWADPAADRPGKPSRLRDSAAGLAETARFVKAAAPEGRFLLTVLAGVPRSAERARMDFVLYSHYPTAVEPLAPGRSLLWLVGLLLLVILLGAFLLKRKGFAS